MRSKIAFLSKVLLLTWLVAAGLSPSRLHAQREGDSEYKERISQAVREFDLGNWQEARALFKQAHQLKPNARTLRGMGMAAFEMRKYLWAMRDLDAALKETRQPLTEEQRAQAQKLLQQSKAFLGRYRLVVEPPTATVEVDEKALELEPDGALLFEIGEHQIVARAPDFQELKQSITVEGSEDKELRLALEPVAAAPVVPPPVAVPPQTAPAPQPTAEKQPAKPAPATAPTKVPEKKSSGPTWAWAAFGIGALTGIGSGTFWILSNKRFDELKKECENFKCDAKSAENGKKEVEQLDKLTSIFLGVSVSFAALSVVLFIVESVVGSSESDEAPKASAASPKFGINPSGLQLEGRF